MPSPETEPLVHPNVLPTDAEPASGGRWLHGWTEAHGPPSLPVVLGWLRQVAAALDFAHRRGHAHGQLGPASIWISDAGHVKIAGLARRTAEESQADLPALSWMAGKLLGSAGVTPRAQVLLRQGSLGRFVNCTAFIEALRRECEPEGLDPLPPPSLRRRVNGAEVIRWTLLFALSAASLGAVILVFFFLANRRT